MFVSMSCTNNPPHNDQCDITLSKAWSSSSKPFLKSMHYMPQSVGFTLWSELTLKASRLWAFVTLELLHNAKNKSIKQIWKGYFALSRDITAKAALEPFICTILQCLNGWDSHNKLRGIKSMMFTPWNLPINYCTIIKMCIFILICEFILKWKCLLQNIISSVWINMLNLCVVLLISCIYTLWVPTLTHLVLWSISILQIVKVFFFYITINRTFCHNAMICTDLEKWPDWYFA